MDSDGLKFVDLFEENALVLELVTLRKHVKGVVDVLVNFLRVSEFLQHTTKDSLTTHPQNLEGKTGVGSTSTLTDTFCAMKRLNKGKTLSKSYQRKQGNISD